MQADLFRQLPSVEQLLQAPAAADLQAHYGRPATLEALRAALDEIRRSIRAGEEPAVGESDLLAWVDAYLATQFTPTLRPVINATGVIIHTNLGRSPLSVATRQAIQLAAENYNTLEYDLELGKRGSRSLHAQNLLTQLTGAEAASVVNNNAAAVLLTLMVLARDHEVIISRGELVEIGGGFRIPEVMAQSGARLVEVGTTNRTHLRDYEVAIGEETAAIMVAHHSNFKQIGFTAEPDLEELAELAHRHDLLLLHDLGSGTLLKTAPFGLAHEVTVQECLAAGVDVVCFSGDKLLGGPQAGLIAGRAEALATIKRHPLARAVRPDKLCLAGLSATLTHYLKDEAVQEIPIWRMIATPPAELERCAQRWVQEFTERGIRAEMVAGESTVGGGSLPGATLPTSLVALNGEHPLRAAARLRHLDVPIIGRVEDDRLVLDPRTVLPSQEQALLDGVTAALAKVGE